MNTKSPLIGLVAVMAASASFAVPTVASAKTTSLLSEVQIKMVVPSTVTNQGAFSFEVLGTGTLKSFNILRKAKALTGNTYVSLKTKVNGKTYTDKIAQNFGQTTYEMVPFSGLNGTGTKGTAMFSPSFFPESATEASGGGCDCYPYELDSGTFTIVTNTKYFGGEAFETTSLDTTVVGIDDGDDFNDGLVIGTGPTGGIGNIYVQQNCTGGYFERAMISFYSPTVKGFSVAYKFGTGVSQCNRYLIQEIGPGAGGGNNMWFTGMVEAFN